MSENSEIISVEEFERLVKEKEYDSAYMYLLHILLGISQTNGLMSNWNATIPNSIANENNRTDAYRYLSTKLISLIKELCSSEQAVSTLFMNDLLNCQSSLHRLFVSSVNINPDEYLQQLLSDSELGIYDNDKVLVVPEQNKILRFLLFWTINSDLTIDINKLWDINPHLASVFCLSYLSSLPILNMYEYCKRAKILKWLPNKLMTLDNITLSIDTVVCTYMYCSYDISENKHRIKQGINHLIRKKLALMDISNRNIGLICKRNSKPVMVVVLEYFSTNHSIYRTHSSSLLAAKQYFYLIACISNKIDKIAANIFDEIIIRNFSTYSMDGNCEYIRNICESNKAAVLYMPSVGMNPITVYISNIRLAPIQVIALGHPATTHSDCIDYVMVEDDYVGDESCFSEKLIRLPKDALPYVPSSAAPEKVEYKRLTDTNPDIVHIGVATSIMKLNPFFLDACRAIHDRAKVKIKFHFALGTYIGLDYVYVNRFLKSYLGEDVIAYPSRPYKEYLEVLSHCDMCINPFPFGNTNGIIDMVTLGLVGVCKTGREVHEHIDEGLFRRLGLPDWLITKTADEYVAAAIRLAENHEERIALRKDIIKNNKLHTLFSGDPSPLGRILFEKVKEKFNLDEAEEIPDWDFEKEAAV
ncbi:MAG: hypothetical protein IJ566_06290 [Cardiobacteriaceae bacterium]|nr:hypothetical protein [Cardiobacteriaceae bacterium]